jgi:hypothetical protein
VSSGVYVPSFYLSIHSIMHSYQCLTLRYRGKYTFLQRVIVHEDGSVVVPEPTVEPTGTWSIQTCQLTPEEFPMVMYFKYQYVFCDTPLVLVNSEQPDTFLRIIERASMSRPPNYVNGTLVKGLQIDVTKIVNNDGESLYALNSFIQNQMNRTTPVSDKIRQELRDTPDAMDVEHVLLNLQSRLTNTANQSNQPNTAAALNPFVARLVAVAARNAKEICPISLDSMASCRNLYVPTCGHVCSDSGCLALSTCPVCREKTAWTSVEFME